MLQAGQQEEERARWPGQRFQLRLNGRRLRSNDDTIRDFPKSERDGRTPGRAALLSSRAVWALFRRLSWLVGSSGNPTTWRTTSSLPRMRKAADFPATDQCSTTIFAPGGLDRKARRRCRKQTEQRRRLVQRGDSRECDDHVMSARANDEKDETSQWSKAGAEALLAPCVHSVVDAGQPWGKFHIQTCRLYHDCVLDVGRHLA